MFFGLSNSSVDDPANVGYTRVGAVDGNDTGLGRVGESQVRQALVALHNQVLGDVPPGPGAVDRDPDLDRRLALDAVVAAERDLVRGPRRHRDRGVRVLA